MTKMSSRWLVVMTAFGCFCGHAAALAAQTAEITPFVGYRSSGAPSAGILVNVPMHDGLQFEGQFTHQPAGNLHGIVDHIQAGGLQEFDVGRVRPYLTGTLGVSRYATSTTNELRVAIAMGGGVKIFPSKAIGLRLDARGFATFLDVDARAVACGASAGTCFFSVNASIDWQCEVFAGLVVRVR